MEYDSSVSDATKPDHQLGPSEQIEELVVEKDVAHPPSPQRSLARSIAIIATCTAAMVVNTSNQTSVAMALANISVAIDIPEDQLQWLISAYSLSSGCLLLFFGRLADLYGRKKGFVIGMCWQMVFALGIGFTNNGITLDILRGLQGMGAAAAIPAALGILAHSFPPSRMRSIAFATFAAGAPVGGAFGNMIGGALTQLSKEHWRAPFFLAAGLSALCVLGALISFDPDNISLESDRRVDWIGATLVTSGLVLIVFVLGQAPVAGWKTPYIIVCLVIGVILVGIFIVWEFHLENSVTGPDKPKSFWTPPPLMKPSIWARAKGRMAVIFAIAFLNWSGFICWTFWVQVCLSLLYYNAKILTCPTFSCSTRITFCLRPVHAMIRFIPMFVMGCICNLFVAIVVGKLPLAVFVVFGTLITGFACVLFALIDPSATYWAFGFPSTVMVVFGADFVYSVGTIFVAKIVLPHEQSLAGGLFQTMTQIGTAFGLTISTIVFNSVVDKESAKLGVTLNSSGTNAPKSAQLQGYRSAQWTGAAFPFLAALLAAIFLRKVGIVGYRKHAEEDPSEQTITEQHAGPQP
ncbi:major facilitator superfamily domain-containing protein [Lanmaoa asiatica]|nr:major facilitator superfamily domain-containing protein [Lanmaoa asiatica]